MELLHVHIVHLLFNILGGSTWQNMDFVIYEYWDLPIGAFVFYLLNFIYAPHILDFEVSAPSIHNSFYTAEWIYLRKFSWNFYFILRCAHTVKILVQVNLGVIRSNGEVGDIS